MSEFIEGIYMVPPTAVLINHKSGQRSYALRLQNIGDVFFMDEEDWNKAKHCLWWFDKDTGRVFNAAGIHFEDYVGIKAPRNADGVEKYNFSRGCYGRD